MTPVMQLPALDALILKKQNHIQTAQVMKLCVICAATRCKRLSVTASCSRKLLMPCSAFAESTPADKRLLREELKDNKL